MLRLLHNPAQIIIQNTQSQSRKTGTPIDSYEVPQKKTPDSFEVLENHSLIIENEIIKDFIPDSSAFPSHFEEVIDVKDKILLPGLIDCHTHSVFAGSRADEFRMKLNGVSYEDIALSGGGISRTVDAVRTKSAGELLEIAKPRINHFISQGITILEIKSGYGLSFDDEIKLLSVINELNRIYPIDIIPTFLGAHTYPSEYKNNHDGYISLIISRMIPYVAENKLARFCDVFCEKTAFSYEETDLILSSAFEHGLSIKLHSDQFNNLGGVDLALKYKAASIDHLEVLQSRDVSRLSASETVCVLLPGVSFFCNYGYAPAKKLIASGARVALSTDYNPGSSPICSPGLIMSLAAIKMGMSIEDTISGFTINAARALRLQNSTGSLEIGKKADISVFDTKEYSGIAYNIGRNLNVMTIKNGLTIYKS